MLSNLFYSTKRGNLRCFRQFHKILQQLQADILAFFRVKLCGKNIVAPNRRRKRFAVFCSRSNDAGIFRFREKAVDEINVTAVFNSTKKRATGLHNVELVPADLRNFQSILLGKANNVAFENAQSGGAGIEFLAPFKQRLITDADAEKRFAGLDEIARGFEQFLFAQRIDAIVERADAGQNHRAGVADFFRRFGHAHVRADFEQRPLRAAQIAGAVIKESNHADNLAADEHG
jgi:hypothetical protein